MLLLSMLEASLHLLLHRMLLDLHYFLLKKTL
jgi:hypothetical protein